MCYMCYHTHACMMPSDLAHVGWQAQRQQVGGLVDGDHAQGVQRGAPIGFQPQARRVFEVVLGPVVLDVQLL